MHAVKAYVNGSLCEAAVEPASTLLELLRDRFGLTGTKEGCGTGYCGACTVLVDGSPVNACLMLAVDADNRDIVTVEGLERDGMLHPVQEAFARFGALQCGYCTPGMIVSAAALLEENPDPSEADIRAGLAGNLCRCTGYRPIVDAVLAAAKTTRAATASSPSPLKRAVVRARA
jgi:aerobic carbon-monoxide dehydrogenase small subunit